MSLANVTIIGRVNVGKSTLFNRLLEKRKALTSDIPGTTRDINSGVATWQHYTFNLIDSGGLISLDLDKTGSQDNLDILIAKKVQAALEKSELILFLVDAKSGLAVQDRLIANFLKKYRPRIILVANKCDNPRTALEIYEFKKLGFGEPVAVSAINGSGTGDLLDMIVARLPSAGAAGNEVAKTESRLPKICLIGKPNAGKSTLLNKIMGEDKMIVSATPHTTREPHDEIIEIAGEKIVIVDTVGVRKRKNIDPKSLEKIGVSLTLKALKRTDLVLLILDTSERISDQDLKLGQLLSNDYLSVIIVGNKSDILKAGAKDKTDDEKKETAEKYLLYFRKSFPHLSYAPVIFISALSGKNLNSLKDLIIEVLNSRKQMISDNALAEILKKTLKKYGAPKFRNIKGRVKKTYIKSLKQKDTNPPVFCITIPEDQRIIPVYLSYLKRELYDKFKFIGTPIKIVVEKEGQ